MKTTRTKEKKMKENLKTVKLTKNKEQEKRRKKT
jgi:hypothetical protein